AFSAAADTPPLRNVNASLYDAANHGLTSTLVSGKQALDANVVNFPGAFGRTWNLTSGSDTVSAVQSGPWNLGRTWVLSSGSDSVSASVSNFPSVQAVSQSGAFVVSQGAPPWDMNLTQVNGSSFSPTNFLA